MRLTPRKDTYYEDITMGSYSFIRKVIRYLAARGFFDWMPDEQYIKLKYWACIGRCLSLKNPTSYNEKLQWIKLNDRKCIYTKMVDKFEAKKMAADIIGSEHIIKTLGVWDRFDDIDFSLLPKQFVLKCTHNSGGLVICHDKDELDIDVARMKINHFMKRNYYLQSREWPYKNVKPRIIAENYMEDSFTGELVDYKFFTFDGKVKAMFISSGRQGEGTRADYFDADFNFLDFTWGYPHAMIRPEKPTCFEEMKNYAEMLAKGTIELRVDFYQVDGKVFFGEMTFFDGGGFENFDPYSWDIKFGSWINLPISLN